MALEGVDYSSSRPDPGQLYAAGKRFAVRYGGPGGTRKHLTSTEARDLCDAGLSLVANAEGTANGLASGWDVGVSWAREADQHFRALGMPAGRPIYLSVDFDVTSAQWPTVAQALRGAASAIGLSRVGVYGGRRAIERARRDGVARWYWQTYAWSAGYWVPGNHIEQYRNGVALAGGTVDLCRAKVTDYGQWTVGGKDIDMFEDQDRHALQVVRSMLDSLVGLRDTWTSPGGSPFGNEAAKAVKALRAELAAAETREVARDAAQTALIEGLAGRAGVPLTDEQLAALTQAVSDAAMDAGNAVLADLRRQEQEREAALRAALDAETGA